MFGKNGTPDGFNSRAKAVLLLTSTAYIEKFIHIQTNVAVTANLAGKLKN